MCSRIPGSILSRSRTKLRSTDRRSTCKHGVRSGASFPSRPTRSISRNRAGSIFATKTRTTPRKSRSAFIPRWLAPEQVRILPIGDEAPLLDYSTSILNELRAHQVRAEIDKSTDKINGKIQRAEQMKVHTMLVIGNRDMDANAVSVRVHGKGNLGAKPRYEVVADILQSIKERRA